MGTSELWPTRLAVDQPERILLLQIRDWLLGKQDPKRGNE